METSYFWRRNNPKLDQLGGTIQSPCPADDFDRCSPMTRLLGVELAMGFDALERGHLSMIKSCRISYVQLRDVWQCSIVHRLMNNWLGLSTGQFLVWGINSFSWSEVSNKKQLKKLLANSDPCYLMLQHDPGAEYSWLFLCKFPFSLQSPRNIPKLSQVPDMENQSRV